MNCPKCQAAMESVKYEGVEIDRCTACKGLWFDMLEQEDLKKLQAAKKIDIGDAMAGKKLDFKSDIECPKCHAQMLKMVVLNQPHIRYESCSVCYGVFFDAGEFRDYKEETVADVFKDLLAIARN